MVPDLRILVDGDARVYRRGDKVTGRVVLGVENEENVAALRISFSGVCTTTTNRPVYNPHRADATAPMQRYQERVRLFNFEQDLLSGCLLASNKESRTFDFKFPELTTPRYSKWQHGPKYLKSPHPLPPSFQTDTSGGQAVITYFLRATLVRGGSHRPLETQEILPYHPTPDNIQLEPQAYSRVLYAQIWKPLSDSRTTMDKAMSKLSRHRSASNAGPRIVPTIHHPEMIAPGQNIPLYISLEDVSHAPQCQVSQCTLDSVTVKMSTHTTSICGQSASSPEDIHLKRVTCLSKTNLEKPLPFNTKTKLAHNFRLVDDAECVPSFKTYTVTRRYDLSVAVVLKYEGREFTVRFTTLLEILPRVPRELMPGVLEEEEDEPLPPYAPREPSREFAPQYESNFQLEQGSSSETSLAYARSRGSSTTSSVSTPASELGGMSFVKVAVRPG